MAERKQSGADRVGAELQPSLFSSLEAPYLQSLSDVAESERRDRTGDQWILAVVGYLEYRAGSSWRKLHISTQRQSPVRWHYLLAIRLLLDVRYAEPSAHCSLCAVPCGAEKKPPARHLPTMEQVRRIAR